jgi:outer membrane lipoprotein LolB
MTRPVPLAGAALVAAIALAACVHVASVDDGYGYAERQARLDAVADWDLSGRLRIVTEEDSQAVSVRWQQRGEELRLEVSGPLGAGSFRISGNADVLTIEDRDGIRVLDDPETDLERQYGWWLPISSLEYWVLGQPDERVPKRDTRGAAGTLASLQQRDWQILYEEYQLAGDLLIPRIVTLSHATLELRLIVRDFEPAEG